MDRGARRDPRDHRRLRLLQDRRHRHTSAGATSGEQIRVEGHQFYWQFVYPNGAISIDTLRLPYGRNVRLKIVSRRQPQLVGPGAEREEGRDPRQGELPVLPAGQARHLRRPVRRVLRGPARGDDRPCPGAAARRVRGLRAIRAQLAPRSRQETFTGVCAKCHGLAGQGDIGPPIASKPLLQDPAGLRTLLRNGVGLMPAVGKDWTGRQQAALLAYLHVRFGQGGGSGS